MTIKIAAKSLAIALALFGASACNTVKGLGEAGEEAID